MSLISIGSDMELFAQTKKGQHIALCGKIGGSKNEPLQLAHLPVGFMVQEDNVALEFNVPVCNSRTEFVQAFRIMRQEVKKILSGLDLVMSTNASVSFGKEELTHPNALVFGCEPDYNAWSVKENQKPRAIDENLRTAGGHIHIGTQVDMLEVTKHMDLYIGVPSVLLDDSKEAIARRELYGKAGAMRPKPYGLEYRVSSNFWMFSDRLVSWVFENTRHACNLSFQFDTITSERIQKCINTGDKEEARTLINLFNVPLPA